MFEPIGTNDEGFALLVSPTPRGQFSVAIYPRIAELSPQVEVSTTKFRQFLMKYHRQVQLKRISGTLNLLLSAVTEDKVRDLVDGSRRLMSLRELPLTA